MDLFQMTSPLSATKSEFYFYPAVMRSISEDDFIIHATSVNRHIMTNTMPPATFGHPVLINCQKLVNIDENNFP